MLTREEEKKSGRKKIQSLHGDSDLAASLSTSLIFLLISSHSVGNII